MNKKQPLALILAANIFITGAGGVKAIDIVEEARTTVERVQEEPEQIKINSGIKIAVNSYPYVPKDANGKEVMVFAYNGTTYVPFRAICDAMTNTSIKWVAEENSIYIETKENNVLIKNDESDEISQIKDETKTINVTTGIKVYYNGELVNDKLKDANGQVVDVIAYNGTTYGPLRGVLEGIMGQPVAWDGKTKTAMLGTQKELPSVNTIGEKVEEFERKITSLINSSDELITLNNNNYYDFRDEAYKLEETVNGLFEKYGNEAEYLNVTETYNDYSVDVWVQTSVAQRFMGEVYRSSWQNRKQEILTKYNNNSLTEAEIIEILNELNNDLTKMEDSKKYLQKENLDAVYSKLLALYNEIITYYKNTYGASIKAHVKEIAIPKEA